MSKSKTSTEKRRYTYKLLATNRTSTMQKELQEGGNEGFLYKDQTVVGSLFGGNEVVVILELDRENRSKVRYEYIHAEAEQKRKAQRREAVLRCHILNRMAELGRPKSYAVVS